ncbi:MAG: hypothetical protein GX234_06530 [Clostridiales bacterium]|nr:hypothetical protein [Clostridiales bacterium]
MAQEEWMQEGMDFRLTFLLLVRKIGYIIVAGILCSALAGGIYLVRHVVYAPAREYEAVSRYYIDFTVDENGDRAYDYYNAATWNDVAASDPILDYTMSLLPEGYDKETVKNAVFCEQPSDYRIITTTVTTHDPEQTGAIQKATEESILHFGNEMEEFEKISVIMSSETELVAVDLHTFKVFVLGGIAGILLMTVILIFRMILDTSIYVESTFERRYGYPVLGVVFARKNKKREMAGKEIQNLALKECRENLSYLGGGEQIVVPLWDKETEHVAKAAGKFGCKSSAGILEHPENCAKLREADGVILAVKSGRDCGKQLDKAISLLLKQGCKITGAILYDVNGRLYETYYRFPV